MIEYSAIAESSAVISLKINIKSMGNNINYGKVKICENLYIDIR